jgi:glycerol-3-phosphate dehydrogenase (NAD(P)+)
LSANTNPPRIAIIGAGSWGTALSVVLGRRELPIRLWVYETDICENIRKSRQNPVFLQGVDIPPSVEPTNNTAEALDGARIVLSVMPSHVCRPVMRQMLPHLRPDMLLVSATKGLEDETLMRMSEVIVDVLRPAFRPRLGALSGPTFAREVARGDPTALVIASEDRELAQAIQHAFSGPTFRLYSSEDVVGVELAASLKNVIAIAAGICDGLGLGSNSIAALIARGLAEMGRLVERCGGRRDTLAGLAGLGDLVLTCTGGLSRNRTVGQELGRGKKLSEILSSMRMVAEGVKTTSAAVALARRHHLEMPITEQMHRVLFEERSPQEAIRDLMERELKAE